MTLTLSTPWMQAHLETIVCKFGRDREIFVVVEAICAKNFKKFTDGQTDEHTDKRHCISSRNELKKLNEDRPVLSAAKCRPMVLVSRNIKYQLIFAGVPRREVVKRP